MQVLSVIDLYLEDVNFKIQICFFFEKVLIQSNVSMNSMFENAISFDLSK